MRQLEERKKLVQGVWSDSYLFYMRHRDTGTAGWPDIHEDFRNILLKYDDAGPCGKVMTAVLSLLEDDRKADNTDWKDSWQFYVKYHGRPAEPGMWLEATRDFSETIKKHGGETFCTRMMLAAFLMLDEETR